MYLTSSTAGGLITQSISRRVVSNTALTAGGTSILTLDQAVPITTYDTFQIYGSAYGGNIVWRRYKPANAAIAAKMSLTFTYGVSFQNDSGTAGEVTTTPLAEIGWSSSGSPPYTTVSAPFLQDPDSGTLLFYAPTSLVFGGGTTTTPASEIKVLLAINQSNLYAFAPSSGFEGTMFSVDLASNASRAKTQVIYVGDWRDPGNQSNMNDYAQDLLDSIKDTVVEGSITYYDLYEPALTIGTAATVTGDTFTTGYETCTSFTGHPGCPVLGVDLEWTNEGASTFVTTMQCSNRRAHYSDSQFLKPERQYVPLGFSNGFFLGAAGFSDNNGTGQEGVGHAGAIISDGDQTYPGQPTDRNDGDGGAPGEGLSGGGLGTGLEGGGPDTGLGAMFGGGEGQGGDFGFDEASDGGGSGGPKTSHAQRVQATQDAQAARIESAQQRNVQRASERQGAIAEVSAKRQAGIEAAQAAQAARIARSQAAARAAQAQRQAGIEVVGGDDE